MKNRASWTAEMAAFARALHLRIDSPAIFQDSLAEQMLSPAWRAMVNLAPLRWYADRVLFRGLKTFRAGLQVRSRYAEERLEQAIARGTAQYVILAAGLDTFALRRPDLVEKLRIFEVDHPATQDEKRKRLAAARLQLPPRVIQVPIDFEREALAPVLAGSGYVPQERAFLSWVGTTYYLTPTAFRSTLESIAAATAPGSELVFDYMVPPEAVSSRNRRRLALTKRLGKRRSEPTQLLLSAQEMKSVVEACGLEIVEDLSAHEMEERYLSDRVDGLTIYPGYRYLAARRA